MFWMHRMVLLGDEAQMEARFGLFGETISIFLEGKVHRYDL
jgi:hypothetical protein